MTRTSLHRCLGLAYSVMLALAPSHGDAAENKIYRCGQTYQQVPCPADGAASAQVVNAGDPRTAEQRSDAKAAAAADKQQAKALVAERAQREKTAQPQLAPMGTSMRAAEPAASAPEAGEPRTHARKHKKKANEPDRYLPNKPPAGKG